MIIYNETPGDWMPDIKTKADEIGEDEYG